MTTNMIIYEHSRNNTEYNKDDTLIVYQYSVGICGLSLFKAILLLKAFSNSLIKRKISCVDSIKNNFSYFIKNDFVVEKQIKKYLKTSPHS